MDQDGYRALFPEDIEDYNWLQQFNTPVDVATSEDGLQDQQEHHSNTHGVEVCVTGPPAMMESNQNLGEDFLMAEDGLLGRLDDSTKQWRAMEGTEASPRDQNGVPGSFSGYSPHNSLSATQVSNTDHMTLDPLLLELYPASLGAEDPAANAFFKDAMRSPTLVPEIGNVALHSVEPACPQQELDQLRPVDGGIAFSAFVPIEESRTLQEITKSVPQLQPRFRSLVPKQTPPVYGPPNASSVVVGRKRRRSPSSGIGRLSLDVGIPKSHLDVFTVATCRGETRGRLADAKPTSKWTKKQGKACQRCREDRKRCDGGIPCKRCRGRVVDFVLHQREKRLQSSVIGWTCYFDSKLEDLNVFEDVTTQAIGLLFAGTDGDDRWKTFIAEVESGELIKRGQEAAACVVSGMGDYMNSAEVCREGSPGQVDIEVQCGAYLCLHFIIMMLRPRIFMTVAKIDHLRLIALISMESSRLFSMMSTIIDSTRKRKNFTPASRMVLLELFGAMAFIASPLFRMKLHQLVIATLSESTKLFLEQTSLTGESCFRFTASTSLSILAFEKAICSAAFNHLSAMAVYWLQRLGTAVQVDSLQEESLVQVAMQVHMTTKEQRNGLDADRLLHSRLEACRWLQKADDDELELAESFDDADVDWKEEIACNPYAKACINKDDELAAYYFVKAIFWAKLIKSGRDSKEVKELLAEAVWQDIDKAEPKPC